VSTGDLLTAIAASAGIVSGAGTLAAALSARLRTTQARRGTEVARVDAVMESPDLALLGTYLYDQVGDVSLADLARDRRLNDQVDAVVARVIEFIGPEPEEHEPAEGDAVEAEGEPPLRGPAAVRPADDYDIASTPDLVLARSEILSGNVWNGLARLRRDLERSLRAIAEAYDVGDKTPGTLRLMSTLVRTGVLPQEIEPPGHRAIDLANRAVHGEDVPIDQALSAWQDAAIVQNQLARYASPFRLSLSGAYSSAERGTEFTVRVQNVSDESQPPVAIQAHVNNEPVSENGWFEVPPHQSIDVQALVPAQYARPTPGKGLVPEGRVSFVALAGDRPVARYDTWKHSDPTRILSVQT
jgi:hypothetical protein